MAAQTYVRSTATLVRGVKQEVLATRVGRKGVQWQIMPGEGYVMTTWDGTDPSESVGFRYERGRLYTDQDFPGSASYVSTGNTNTQAIEMILIMPGLTGTETARVEFLESS